MSKNDQSPKVHIWRTDLRWTSQEKYLLCWIGKKTPKYNVLSLFLILTTYKIILLLVSRPFLSCPSRKCTGVTININNGFLLFKCLSKLWQCANKIKSKDPELEAATWNKAIINFSIGHCMFLTKTECLLQEAYKEDIKVCAKVKKKQRWKNH